VSEFAYLGATELLAGYRARLFSPVEVVAALADRITAIEPLVCAFTTTCFERAFVEAGAAEAAWARGSARALEGVPLGVKDIFDSAEVRTTYGSTMFASHVPGRDSEALRRARESGAVLIGKTQTHEFAFGITSINEGLGSTHNPWALDRVSGGSSGGSAVALAAGEVPLAIGTDTAGSIRVPAALCGVVGLKPTRGCVSREGAFPLAPSFDHVGPMARSPADAALLLEAISEPGAPLGDVRAGLELGFAGLRIGLCPDLHRTPLAPAVKDVYDGAVRMASAAGAEVIEVDLPVAERIPSAFIPVQRAEALRSHVRAGLYPGRRHEYGADVLERLEAGLTVTLDQYLDASAEGDRIRGAFGRLLASCDVLLTPVAAGAPFPDAQAVGEHLGREVDFGELVLPYTTPQNLCGLPACTVLAGFDGDGVPIGLQFTGRPWSEASVLRAVQALYESTGSLRDRTPAI